MTQQPSIRIGSAGSVEIEGNESEADVFLEIGKVESLTGSDVEKFKGRIKIGQNGYRTAPKSRGSKLDG